VFNLTDKQVRWIMVASLVGGFAIGIPLNLVLAKIFGQWIFWVMNGFSFPFAVANVYWLFSPQSYNRFNEIVVKRCLQWSPEVL
jgi:Na+-driven multidrug efflux pump